MKIALVNSATNYWLAGETGVSESVHSSAGNVVIEGAISVEQQNRVRAAGAKFRDRLNLAAAVSFTTTRKFTTLLLAETFILTYDITWPRTGTVDFYGANGDLVVTLNNAIVPPPTRILRGVSVELSYLIHGSEWAVPPPPP